MNRSQPISPRLDELLFVRALEGLSDGEERELALLLAREPDVDARIYERAAAAVCIATLAPTALPVGLRASVEADAAEILNRKDA
jgi:hypothetical protein